MENIADFLKENIIVIIMIFILILFLVAAVSGYLLYFQKRNKEALWRMAYIDPLTKLPNLNKFKFDAEELFHKTADHADYYIIRFDIDNFKIVNDRFGYEMGDRVLKEVKKAIIPYLSEENLFARISNDDFLILGCDDDNIQLVELKNNIIEEFNRSSVFAGTHYRLSFSCGVYRVSDLQKDINTMLDRATIAHKEAKRTGKNSLVFYNEQFLSLAMRTQDIENAMRTSLQNGDFVIYLQTQYELKSKEICGAEALIRWNHPTLGFLTPGEFIPIFEKNGFILDLDNFVLSEICKFQRKRIDRGTAKPLPIAINQSRLHLSTPDYISSVREIVSSYNLPPKLIELEVTESALHEDIDQLIYMAKSLSEYGFIISIDDFGSGYSSLNMLKDIAADNIKIDREFLVNSESNQRSRTILSKVIELIKSLDMTVIVEGVETAEQETLLKELNCDNVQGYYYSMPIPIGEFEKLY